MSSCYFCDGPLGEEPKQILMGRKIKEKICATCAQKAINHRKALER